ncbi:hypothetical protein [Paenibacillus arenosi]|uniref:SLH domain-containing protein n=1 Tax=Paenibacillus arenosi TaxID=2774142 RepID=A0ABR9AXS6_9BACL|nr:hypothetical protein [Paenibacillus arenosi]MBD8498888.1 hypothetical protein [Paenibacillus arenosi]
MKRWIDVDPLDWFYRDVLEIDRLFTDETENYSIVDGISYNMFERGYERIVKRFITVENQKEFLIPNYKYHADNPMYVCINGIDVVPEEVQDGKVILSAPLSAGMEVVCIAYGKVAYRQEGCVKRPDTGCSQDVAPHADLKHKANYQANLKYRTETCTVLGVKLKKRLVEVKAGEDPDKKITQAIGFKRDIFVVHKGRVYLPAKYDGFPAKIGYNYYGKGAVRYTVETVIVESPCVKYNDRFFPSTRLRRSEFFTLISRMRANLYNRFTDHSYQHNPSPKRPITDKDEWIRRWYGADVAATLDERYMDGCYVFPLYEDGKFEPEECVTRAEAVTYLNRFIEWAIEKFR